MNNEFTFRAVQLFGIMILVDIGENDFHYFYNLYVMLILVNVVMNMLKSSFSVSHKMSFLFLFSRGMV